MAKLSLFQQHCERWKDGCGASICDGARKCFCRGKIPCDVLFAGQGPGESENAIGQPFIGPAGHLLDKLIQQTFPGHWDVIADKRVWIPHLRIAYANIVCCIPRDEVGKETEPDDDSILACQPRLVEFVEIAKPKIIICVGAMARDWLATGYTHSAPIPRSIPRVDITHPGAILKSNITMKGIMSQRVMVSLSNAVEEHFPGVE